MKMQGICILLLGGEGKEEEEEVGSGLARPQACTTACQPPSIHPLFNQQPRPQPSLTSANGRPACWTANQWDSFVFWASGPKWTVSAIQFLETASHHLTAPCSRTVMYHNLRRHRVDRQRWKELWWYRPGYSWQSDQLTQSRKIANP